MNDSHGEHPHRFNPERMHLLDSAERRQMLPAEKLLNQVPVRANDTVVDLGAGTGYFSIPAAQMTDAPVHAVDVAPQMMEELISRAKQAGVDNIRSSIGVIEAVPLEDGLADVVIASMVLHEVEPLSKGLSEIHRLLKPNGRLLCVDWEAKESPMGPPLHIRIESGEMEKALQDAGLRVISRQFPEPYVYVLIAEKA